MVMMKMMIEKSMIQISVLGRMSCTTLRHGEAPHGMAMMMAATTTNIGGLEKTVAAIMVNPDLPQELCDGNVCKVHTLLEVLQSLYRQG